MALRDSKPATTAQEKLRPNRAADLEIIYVSNRRLAYHILRQLGVPICEWGDHWHDAIVKLATTAGEFTPATARAYLAAILRTSVIDESRTFRRRCVKSLADDCDAVIDSGEDTSTYEREVAAIGAAIDAVGDDSDRKILTWAYRDGLTAKEIAQRTGDALGTVTSKLCRLRTRYHDHFSTWVLQQAA